MTTEHIEETVETFIAPGLLLKEAREELNLTLEDISSRLRLRVEVLEQIEADQFDMGKLATFTRGYYRSYAKVVNVPEQKVLDALDQLGKAQIEQHDMQSFSRKTKREKHDNRIMKLTWVIFALILGMSVLWWWQEQAQLESANDAELIAEVETAKSMEQVEENKTDSPQTEETAPTLDEAEMLQLDTNISELETDSKTLEKETIKKPEAEASVEVKKEEPVAEKAVVTEDVVMTFNSDCWLQVQDASNNRLYSGVKKSNQTLKLTGKAPYKLIIGAPNAVTLTYKGKPVDLSVYPAGKVARLTLPQ
ncbi:cytoskeleton protein RodZ [Aliivibrio fischeri]|uniref:cytoskeleton protein RodZ n=1 Tax=Aliivibrio fischeri TaxID=668 RepID=UPI0012DA9E96|nr:cytoskeleton protein RodZ [Aliivibrio fischeri]MUK69437.1 cytoskeleton protein RodZ [Aliivibrio fischeri]MUK75214.1 cytoskeleton protein RodZ [Aliivibrio fischeri]